MSKPQLKTRFQPKISCLSGPDSGRSFYITKPEFTIGRSLENEIVIKDSQCSRKHVAIKVEGNRATIKNISSQKTLKVDQKETTKVIVVDKAIIEIGETQLEVILSPSQNAIQNIQAQQHLSVVQPSNPPPQVQPQAYPQASHQPNYYQPQQAPAAGPPIGKPKFKNPKQKSNKQFFIILSVVGLLGYWLFSDNGGPKKEVVQLTSEQEQLQVLEQLQKQQQALLEAKAKRGVGSTIHNEAQSLYQQCFREYQNGRYQRSIDYCTASLTINPDHQLAQTYQKKALVKLDEQIRFHMVRGQQYREQNKFDYCISSFKEAMVLIKDDNSLNYKKALTMKNECEILLDGN
jgi:tetratricopeptide (TPR) repeat protein